MTQVNANTKAKKQEIGHNQRTIRQNMAFALAALFAILVTAIVYQYAQAFWLKKALLRPAPGEFIAINKMAMHYRQFGSGPNKIVIIHDTLDSATSWIPLAEKLSQSDFTVYIPDQIGSGYSDKPEKPIYTMSFLEQNYQKFVSKLNIESFTVLANGTGSRIAIALSNFDPSKIKRLILINAANPTTWRPQFFRFLSQPVLGQLYFSWLSPRLLRRTLKNRFFFDHNLVSDELVAMAYQEYNAPGAFYAALSQLRAFSKEPVTENESQQTFSISGSFPIHLIWSSKSVNYPVAGGYAYREQLRLKHSNLQWLEFPDAGSAMHYEKAEQIANVINTIFQAKQR